MFFVKPNGHKITKKSHGTVAYSTNSTAKAGLCD